MGQPLYLYCWCPVLCSLSYSGVSIHLGTLARERTLLQAGVSMFVVFLFFAVTFGCAVPPAAARPLVQRPPISQPGHREGDVWLAGRNLIAKWQRCQQHRVCW